MHESPKWVPALKTRKQVKSVRALQSGGGGPPHSLQVDQTRLPQMSRTILSKTHPTAHSRHHPLGGFAFARSSHADGRGSADFQALSRKSSVLAILPWGEGSRFVCLHNLKGSQASVAPRRPGRVTCPKGLWLEATMSGGSKLFLEAY